jgi:hypothetical protein
VTVRVCFEFSDRLLGALQVIDDKNGYRFSEIEDIKGFSMTTGNKE